MKRMITLAVGGAIGYVLGAKAGRERYDQIVESAGKLLNREGDGGISSVRSTAVDKAATLTDTARQKAHDTIDLVDAKVDAAADKVKEQADKAAPSSSPSSGSRASSGSTSGSTR
jgi:hypothetical protein